MSQAVHHVGFNDPWRVAGVSKEFFLQNLGYFPALASSPLAWPVYKEALASPMFHHRFESPVFQSSVFRHRFQSLMFQVPVPGVPSPVPVPDSSSSVLSSSRM
ncbi:hypothetical protein EYF80_028040 [Liparis tanakae]|uniref:Uncharacterized protein n=1 Tax=Liparis tanakae TaxID=230148 RepID=A0A4Z2H7W7_9TELE|nr:hypothetical protein EYF80_028040 [Liparis tanakae]